jgi:uncharacterized protein DUF6941
MQCELFAVAQSAVVDIATNRLSIFNIWDEIITPSIPAFVPSVTLAAVLKREENEPNEIEIQIVVTLNGHSVAQLPTGASFQEKLKTRLIVNMQGMVFTEQGVCEIAIRYGDASLAVWRILVNLIAQPQVQTVEVAPVGAPLPVNNTD